MTFLSKLNKFGSNKKEYKLHRKLIARIEIIRVGYKEDKLDYELEQALHDLHLDLVNLVYDDEQKKFKSISSLEVIAIISFSQALIEIFHASKTKDRKIIFSSQRVMFLLFGYCLSHPSFSELFCTNWNADHVMAINEVIYSLAENQNMYPQPSGDVTANGEWVATFFDKYRYGLLHPNKDGVFSVFRLWKDICLSTAQLNPTRLKNLYESMRDGAVKGLGVSFYAYNFDQPAWYPSWRKEYLKLNHTVGNLDEYRFANNALSGEGETKGVWSEIQNLSRNEPIQSTDSFCLEEHYSECIQQAALSSIFWFFALLGHFELWRVLHSCWYCSQPNDTQSHWIQHKFFSRDPLFFWEWLVTNYKSVDKYLYDRHDVQPNIIKSATIIFADFVENNPAFSIQASFNNHEQLDSLSKILKGISSNLSIIESQKVADEFSWKSSSTWRVNTCKKVLEDAIERFTIESHKVLSSIKPSKNNKEDQELIFEIWGRTQEQFWKRFKVLNFLPIEYTNVLPAVNDDKVFDGDGGRIERKFEEHHSYYYTKRSNHTVQGSSFRGDSMAEHLFFIMIRKLFSVAEGSVSQKNPNTIWLLPIKKRPNHQVESAEVVQSCYGITPNSNDTFHFILQDDFALALEQGAASIKLFTWSKMPWDKDEMPTVVYGFVDFSEKATGSLSLYYDLQILDAQKITTFI